MRIFIEDLQVIFPYSLVFNEQEVYMKSIKHALDQSGHAILEMPTGTGKTICLLALLTAYLSQRTKYKKVTFFSFSSSTAPELLAKWKKHSSSSKNYFKREKRKTRREKNFFA